MTRHTPEYLRQRSSNLSLRLAASQSSSSLRQSALASQQAPTAAPTATPTAAPNPTAAGAATAFSEPLTQADKAWLTYDLSNSRTAPPLCQQCRKDTRQARARKEHYFSFAEEQGEPCTVCALMNAEPAAFAEPFCRFLQDAPTVFHAADYFKSKAESVGFTKLDTAGSWYDRVRPGGKYVLTRNGSSVIAFTVGKAYKPGNGVAMIAGHIDAITARLKPVSKKPNKAGYLQLGVAPYAGGLNETWWDRDLSIGGRVIVRDQKTGKNASKLVKLDWPIARVPTLAPHFGVGMLGNQNKETEAVPIVGVDNSDLSSETQAAKPLGPVGSFVAKQPPKLVKVIASELGVKDYGEIVGWELELFDLQPATVGGIDKDLIFGGRIDDKLCSWGAFQGLLASDADEKDDSAGIKLVALFDDEEIGSLLRQGAKGDFLPRTIERIVEALSEREDERFGPDVVSQTYAQSFLVSADVTHAVNPNFLGRYLDDHAPRLNTGIVLCADSNGHMTTDAVSTRIVNEVCQLAKIAPPQTFMIRNDSRSGGTVGPMLSSAMGVRSADAGMPQLSMHSIRATTGALDPGLGFRFFKGFLDHFEQANANWSETI